MPISPGKELCKRGAKCGLGAVLTLSLKVATPPLDHGITCPPRFSCWPSRQRLTLGLLSAEVDNGQQARKVDVLRIGGTGSVVLKHCRKPQLGSPGDVVLDVDVSLRHADVLLGTDECTDLCKLLAAYLARAEKPTVDLGIDVSIIETTPIKPLFHEDFWYFEGSSNNSSGDLNFDTLSSLLEQVILFFFGMAAP